MIAAPLHVMAGFDPAIQGGVHGGRSLDGRVEPGHGVDWEQMAETQKLIGISLEGSVG